MRFHHAGPSLYIYDGVRGRYEIACCPLPEKRVDGVRSGRMGWEVHLPVTGAFTKVRTLDEARRLIEAHDGDTSE